MPWWRQNLNWINAEQPLSRGLIAQTGSCLDGQGISLIETQLSLQQLAEYGRIDHHSSVLVALPSVRCIPRMADAGDASRRLDTGRDGRSLSIESQHVCRSARTSSYLTDTVQPDSIHRRVCEVMAQTAEQV